jgi:hypothetical protein
VSCLHGFTPDEEDIRAAEALGLPEACGGCGVTGGEHSATCGREPVARAIARAEGLGECWGPNWCEGGVLCGCR